MDLKKCPKCKMSYKRPSAISRLDNKTEICELCSLAESITNLLNYLLQKKQK